MTGKELFEQQAKKWLDSFAEGSFYPGSDPLRFAVEEGKVQIRNDVLAEKVPVDVGSFADLHDYVDANYYGQAFEWPLFPSDVEDEYGHKVMEQYSDCFCQFWNKVQDELDKWIKSGGVRKQATA